MGTAEGRALGSALDPRVLGCRSLDWRPYRPYNPGEQKSGDDPNDPADQQPGDDTGKDHTGR